VHEQNKDELINHLTSHCLRKKVDIEDLSGFLDIYGATVRLMFNLRAYLLVPNQKMFTKGKSGNNYKV